LNPEHNGLHQASSALAATTDTRIFTIFREANGQIG
jgi:hypothetical protein